MVLSTVRLPEAVADVIVSHARREAPRECCGLLIGAGDEIVEAVPAANLADNPLRRYLIDPHDHLRAIRSARERGLEVTGAYHSHPRSAAIPSPTDAAEAFPGFVFLIIGLADTTPELTAWSWADGNFTRLSLVRF